MSTNAKQPLDMLYQWENNHKNRLYMTQPMDDGTVDEFTWGRAADEARRMAAHLKSLDLPEKSRIGIISKNCAHFIMTDWSTCLGGPISVPLYPMLTAGT